MPRKKALQDGPKAPAVADSVFHLSGVKGPDHWLTGEFFCRFLHMKMSLHLACRLTNMSYPAGRYYIRKRGIERIPKPKRLSSVQTITRLDLAAQLLTSGQCLEDIISFLRLNPDTALCWLYHPSSRTDPPESAPTPPPSSDEEESNAGE